MIFLSCGLNSTTRVLSVVSLIFLLLYDCRGDLESARDLVRNIHGREDSKCSCESEDNCQKLTDISGFERLITDNKLNHNFYSDLVRLRETEALSGLGAANFSNVIGVYSCQEKVHRPVEKVCQGLISDQKSDLTPGLWTPIYCPKKGDPVVARYLITRKEERYVIEFDMRNFELDLCRHTPNFCKESEECKFSLYSKWNLSLNNYKCICSKECSNERNLVQKVPLTLQIFCIISCFILGAIIFKFRSTKVMKLSNWFLLEIYLLGAILLYFATFAYYIYAEEWSCFLGPWLRVIGFSVMYGVLLVKIYRVLSSFQSRKAHRVYVRDKDMLKYLGVFIGIHVALMAGWTCINLDYISNSPWSEYRQLGLGMLTETDGDRGKIVDELTDYDNSTRYVVCRVLSWNIVSELIEFITLIFAIRYCRMVKSAPNEYNEISCITYALLDEAIISGIFHITRHFIWTKIHPEYSFLLDFLRSQFTVTTNVILIIAPKLWYTRCRNTGVNNISTNIRGIPNEGNKQDLLSYTSDGDFTDINLSDMDPEVIRRELKRLYAQIEIYKLKAIRRDNPHVPKRRGGRKQRRFSLQPFHKKHHAGGGGGAISQIQSDSPSVVQSGSGPNTQSPETVHISPESHHRSDGGFFANRSGHGKYPNTIMVHEEEISRISEDSVNSVDDTAFTLLNVKLNSND